MKFNNILSEALIDDLKIRKIEKAVLRKFNDDDVSSSDEVYEISKEYGMPLHISMSLYYTYLKYKDFLFNGFSASVVNVAPTLLIMIFLFLNWETIEIVLSYLPTKFEFITKGL